MLEETTSEMQSAATLMAAAAACRLPRPLGRLWLLSVAWIRLPADSTTPSPRMMKAPSIEENSFTVSSMKGLRMLRSSSL